MPLNDILIQKFETNAHISGEDRALIAQLPVFPKSVRAHEDIARQGTEPDHSVFVIEGVLARYQEFAGGDRQTVSLHLKGEMPDLHSLYVRRMDHTLGAVTPAQIALVRHEDLKEAFAKSRTLGEIFWRETLLDAAIFRQWIANNGKRGALAGTAHLLCELYVRAKVVGLLNADGTWTVPLTQQQLADALGLSIVHLNRTLRNLRQSSTVVLDHTRRMQVVDWNRLVKTAGFDPTYLHLVNEHKI